jgi:uncharacterized OB-fold protein
VRNAKKRTSPARPAHAPLPPATRSRIAVGLTAAAAAKRFRLQVCAACGAVQYPPREACHRCLSVDLKWKPQPAGGLLIAQTRLYHSESEYFRARLPLDVGMIQLDCGPVAIAFLGSARLSAPARVRLRAMLDASGQAVLVAAPEMSRRASRGAR